MAKRESTITVTGSEYRPCIVSEQRALFHRWENKTQIVPPSPKAGGHGGGVLHFVMGIVENESGEVEEVMPYEIRFVDNIIKDYCFDGGAPNDA